MSSRRSFWDLLGEVPKATPAKSVALRLMGEPAQGAQPNQRQAFAQPRPCALDFDENHVFWAMRNMPVVEATKHFMICGAVGAGKTTAIELYLQSIAPRFRSDRAVPEQLIIFDAMRDIVPTLAGFGLGPEQENVWLLNPFDERCAVWNLAEAAQTPAMARYIATLLVPPEKDSTSPFFSTAARDLLVYVMWGLNTVLETRWTFRDLLCAADSREHIEMVTAHHPRARRLALSILKDDKHAFGVISTLTTKLGQFEEVAALWHSRPQARRFSIAEFMSKPGVLVLGWDPVLNESLWPINAILLKAISDEILRGPRRRTPRHWFVFDEFRAMGKVEAIHNLLNRGRSKGASVLIALQTIEGLIDVYQSHRAEDILSACAHKTILRLGDPKSAAWAEEYFGKIRRTEQTHSESWSSQGHSESVQYDTKERSVFLASYFMDLPFTGPGRPYKAVNDVPWLGSTIITERWFDDLNAWRLLPPEGVEAFQPRLDPLEQTLLEWSPDEESLFEVRRSRRKATSKKPGLTKKALPAPRVPKTPGPPEGLFGPH